MPEQGKAWTVPQVEIEMVYLPGGTFEMDLPRKAPVTISRGFWIAKHETTQQQYEKRISDNPSQRKHPTDPVSNVTWNDCMRFCILLTRQEREARRLPAGFVYRMPTEAEWEYACRAGSSTTYYFGNDSAKLGDYAWYSDNSTGKYHNVGLKLPNNFGLYDMLGNVWEFCFRALPIPGTRDPFDAEVWHPCRTVRGGGFQEPASDIECSKRTAFDVSFSADNIGFRVVLAPKPATYDRFIIDAGFSSEE